MRFPLALKSLPDSVLEVVPVIVADIVEEQTGSRPIMSGFKPDVKLDGTDVKLTLNGLGADDLGKLSLGDLTKEAITRTTKWVVHAVTLIAAVSSTKDALSFEEDTLDALLDGFAASGWKKATAATIPGGDDPKVASATAAKPHARKAASAAKVGVAEAQGPKAVVAAATASSKTEKAEKADKPTPKKADSTTTASTKTTTSKPDADPPAAAPELSATVEHAGVVATRWGPPGRVCRVCQGCLRRPEPAPGDGPEAVLRGRAEARERSRVEGGRPGQGLQGAPEEHVPAAPGALRAASFFLRLLGTAQTAALHADFPRGAQGGIGLPA